MQSTNRKRFIIIGAGVVALLLVIGLSITITNRDNSKQPKTTRYTDPDSGQTVTEIEGKTPEYFNTDSAKPTLLGFAELLDHGTTRYQLQGVENSFITYSKQQKIKEVSLKVDSIKVLPRQPNTIKNVIEFEVKFDRKPVYYKTSVESTGISRLQVRLYDMTGKLLYDSGAFDALDPVESDADD